MPIEVRGRYGEVQGFTRKDEDIHPSLGSRHAGHGPLRPPITGKTAKIDQQKPQPAESDPQTLLKGVWRKWKYLNAQEGFQRAPLLTLFRLILWRLRCLLRWPATIDLRGSNVRLFLPARWRGIEKVVYGFRDNYEPELTYLKKVLSPGQTFVDVGACYGIYALIASRVVGRTGRVIAFEPSFRAFPILRKNISLNNLVNVQAYCLALSDRRGRTLLYRHPNVGCDSFGKDDSFPEDAQETATETLDNVVRERKIERVDVVKMDVQGAEEWVLLGAKRILTTMHPIVIFESWPAGPPLLGLSPNGAWDFLDSLGYEFFVLEAGGSLIDVKSPPVDCNVVAIHTQSR